MGNDTGIPTFKVAVALVMDRSRRILWTFNPNWGAFALPMTKRRNVGDDFEPAAHAAARAAAEVLGVPVRIGACWGALPELKVSGRDGSVRRYAYEVIRVGPEPDFASAIERPGLLWLNVEQAFSADYRPPLSSSSLDVVTKLILEGRLEGRTQLTSTVILRRKPEEDPPAFCLRWNKDWGFALPSKRRKPEEAPLEAAERVVRGELQLVPGENVSLAVAQIPTFTTYDVSASTRLGTFYVHSLFDATLSAGEPRTSEEDLPLVWASTQEILDGRKDPPYPDARAGEAEPGKISRTVFRILSALDDVPWII